MISDYQFNIVADGKTHTGDTATVLIDDTSDENSFVIMAVSPNTVRSKITWSIEYVSRVTLWTKPDPVPEPEPVSELIPDE